MTGGRVVAVLGASQGIGRAIAARSVADGDRVVMVARTAPVLAGARAAIDPGGRRSVTIACDIEQADAPELVVAEARRSFGEAPSIVVHSAGSFIAGRLGELGDGELAELFQRNVVRTMSVVRRLMERRPGAHGHVVVVNSTAGLQLHPTNPVYSATMIALRSMTDALRNELNPHGVRVTSVFSGRCDTPMLREVLRHEGAAFDPSLALRPSDVAAAVAAALAVGDRAEITEIVVRPMRSATATATAWPASSPQRL